MARIIFNLDLAHLDALDDGLFESKSDNRKFLLIAALHIGNCISLAPNLEAEYYGLSSTARLRLEHLAEAIILDEFLDLWATANLILPPLGVLTNVQTLGLSKVEVFL